ncbi:MAG: putative mycofactocin radical SAM maturase MftC (plasmid) [Chroococcopsis gigantea SAG 12.99]|jgi:MoaA/NifB/PqqE/SkfB family radical SAM enzyme|nr:putative mycofactocin radical SAM maturase MftC [Chroococcopsis gigantea SAG 12.99]
MDSQLGYQAPFRAPFTVCLWLTDFCNLACKYCYAMPFSGRYMETNRLLRLIDECIELGVFDLTIAGGEPLLHPNILDAITHAVNGGMRVGLLTNGVGLNSKMRTELERRTNRKNFIVQISLDSVEPEINDRTRGQTKIVVENIRAMVDSSLDLQIACVISKSNFKTAHQIIDAFYPIVKRYHFLNIQRTEQALKNPELLLDEHECFQFWVHLNEYRKKFPEDLFLPSLRVQMRGSGLANVEPEFNVFGETTFDCQACSAGWTHINIDSDFNMLGCDIAKDYTFMGNLRDRSFTEVWNSKEAAIVRNSPYPACYKITNPTGERLEDWLKSEFSEYKTSDGKIS